MPHEVGSIFQHKLPTSKITKKSAKKEMQHLSPHVPYPTTKNVGGVLNVTLSGYWRASFRLRVTLNTRNMQPLMKRCATLWRSQQTNDNDSVHGSWLYVPHMQNGHAAFLHWCSAMWISPLVNHLYGFLFYDSCCLICAVESALAKRYCQLGKSCVQAFSPALRLNSTIRKSR